MWRTELNHKSPRKSSFIPKDPVTGKRANFNFNNFMDKIKKLNSNVSLYLGGATTPPCLGNIII